jgi:hypothetical protein
MRNRCNCSSAGNYQRYGGRGISICERWNDFLKFYEDMGERPPNHSLDRISSEGDYTPENCRWANHHLQAQNKRNSSKVAGVTFRKERGHWRAIAEYQDGKKSYLGSSKDWFEAVCIRKSWEAQQHNGYTERTKSTR